MDTWLSQYGNQEAYKWQKLRKNSSSSPSSPSSNQFFFRRPLGFCEFSFDNDGRFFEGRADMSCMVKIAISKKKNKNEEEEKEEEEFLRERILLAWTRLCTRHLLLGARTVREKKDNGSNQADQTSSPSSSSIAPEGLHFAVDVPANINAAIESAKKHLIFLQDHYTQIDHSTFYNHTLNTARIIDPDVALAKAFVLPPTIEKAEEEEGEEEGKEENILRIQLILAHQIADGISVNIWIKTLLQSLNDPIPILRAKILSAIDPNIMQKHLPPPQEALYPLIPGSKARQRWFWAITRILRHVRRPLPAGFENPLLRRRRHRIEGGKKIEKSAPIPFPPLYNKVLDYTRTPLLNTIPIHIRVSAQHTAQLQKLVREAKASMGAGIYAMVGVCMMEMYEKQSPEIPLHDRKVFIPGFPLNPRAFFGGNSEPDSMMLAFSDGIALPFLSARLRVAGRLKLLARQAQRQLSVYQKKRLNHFAAAAAGEKDAKKQFLTSRGAGLVLANQYLYSIERADRGKVHHLSNQNNNNIQGQYPTHQNPTPQTCGVSSIGNRDLQIRSGTFPIPSPQSNNNNNNNNAEKFKFAADFRNLTATVRAREEEFLFGVTGSRKALFSTPSIDMSSMDPELVQVFKERFETLLEELESDEGKAKL